MTTTISKNQPNLQQGTKFLGIHFAPLYISLERRIQTFAVLVWLTAFLIAPLDVIFLVYLLFYTNYGWISIAYLVYWLYDLQSGERGGRGLSWPSGRNWKLWKKYCDYFPIHFVKTVDLDPTKNYIFGYHPHGFLASGLFGCFCTEGRDFSKLFPGMRAHTMTTPQNFRLPVIREFLLMLDACSASRQSMNHVLSRPEGGHALLLPVGGAAEALDWHTGKETRIHLKRRKGFVKVAIQNGVPLVPVFSFGETDLYVRVSNPEGSIYRRVESWFVKNLHVAPVTVKGRGIFNYTFGILPKRLPIHVVVGAPIETVKNDHPTLEEIDETHARYSKALFNLFDTHKMLYGFEDYTLISM